MLMPAREQGVSAGESPLNLRRNVSAMLIDAVGWPLGQSFLSPQTILPLFIALLTNSTFVIGLVVAVQSVCLLVPQLFIANHLEHMRLRRIFVVVIGVIMERVPYLVLAITVLVVPEHGMVLVIFFLCWIVANTGTGLNMPAFLGLYAKTIPAQMRGRVGGVGNSVGTLLAVGGAYVTSIILNRTHGLGGFSWLFLIGFLILLVSVLPLGFVDERPSPTRTTRKPTLEYLRELPSLLHTNHQFARYVLFQSLMQLAYSAPPFITAYAVLKLGVTAESVGFSTAILMGATAIGSLVVGLMADRRGYRRIFVVAGVGAILAYGILILLPSLPLVYVSYFLAGIVLSAQSMGNNMTMEYCGPENAGTYTAIVFTASAPARVLGPLALGAIAQIFGMRWVFVSITAVLALSLYLLLFRVRDPRSIPALLVDEPELHFR
jgi:MFS family permease